MEQQKGTPKYYDCPGHYLFIMDKYYRQFLRDMLKPQGMSASEAMVLLLLYQRHVASPREEGYTQEELNKELHYDKAALTRVMKLLEDKNMVLRKPNHADKRSFCFVMAQAGFAMLPEIMKILVAWENEIFAGIEEQEKAVFLQTIMKVAGNAGQTARRCRAESLKEMG